MENAQIVKICLIVGGILLAIFIAIIAMSFAYLDYNELGFKRQKSTSRVYTDKVYDGGRHFVGPDFNFKVYPASANSVVLSSVTVFSKDALEVSLNVEFEYFLRPQQLAILHRKYQLTYNSVIRSSAMDALKSAANNFTTEQFIKDRINLEIAMEDAVRRRIGGRCCEADCSQDKCFLGCIPLTVCTKESDMGLMVNMKYFFLTRVKMPSKVYNRYLKALLLVEESQEEKYKQEEAVVKKEVDESVKAIDNQATEVAANATAQAQLIEKTANAESIKIIGEARGEGLKALMTKCAVNDGKKKMSLHYLETLGENTKVNMAVDFNNYVIGGR